jgi:arylsulfatase A-like enzyme
MRFLSILRVASLTLVFIATACNAEQLQPNILFIAVDDLKPLTGSYGDQLAKTPAINALAESSTVFTRAYVQYPVCGPSRSSMLTGLRPESSGILNLKTRLRDVHPDIVTLPQLFKLAGYETAAVGKIFDPRNVDSREDDDPASWSIPFKMVSGKVDQKSDPNFAYRAIDARSSDFVDGQINDRGIELLKSMAAADRPFFLGVGYKKPHLPFDVPKRFFDLYDPAAFALAEFQSAPESSNAHYLLSGSHELRTYWPQPALGDEPAPYGEEFTPRQQRELMQGYYAAVSFIDELVGQLLDALEASGAADNTIVVLWGDHGFHLGDHGTWGKHTTMEQAARQPLMIHAPGFEGGTSDAIVESLDIYPTLVELAGLEAPHELQGNSLVSVLKGETATSSQRAVTQYRRHGAYGYSLRTERYRYTEWIDQGGVTVYRDLYDMQNDPEERLNIAPDPENTDLLNSLAKVLRDHGPGLKRLNNKKD